MFAIVAQFFQYREGIGYEFIKNILYYNTKTDKKINKCAMYWMSHGQ